MKRENYFASNQFRQKSRSIIENKASSSTKVARIFKPARSALLVLDMQEYFLDSDSHAFIPGAPAIIEPIQKLVDSYQKNGFPIFFTRHINNDSNARMMASWWHEMITLDHPLAGIVPSLDVCTGMVIEKSQYDAFLETPLHDLLEARQVKQIVITGVMTHLCCETTARSGFMRGFEIFFVVDGTATYNLEFHEASMINLGHGFAHLVTTDEIIKMISHKHEE